MTRITVMLVAGALAILVLFALFYVAGIAIGAVLIPIFILLAIGLVIWAMMKRRAS